MGRPVGLATLAVCDDDAAVASFVGALGMDLVEDALGLGQALGGGRAIRPTRPGLDRAAPSPDVGAANRFEAPMTAPLSCPGARP